MAIEKSLLTFIADRSIAIVEGIEADTKEAETKARAVEATLFINQLRSAIEELCDSVTPKPARGGKRGADA